MKYEIKKLKEGLSYKIILLILGIVLFITNFIPLQSYSYIRDISELPLKGMEAIQETRKSYKQAESELSIAYLNEVFTYYHSFSDPTRGELETNRKYPGVLPLIMEAYGTLEEPNYYLNGVDSVNDFYDRNNVVINANSSSEDYELLEKKLNKIEGPYFISFSKPWVNMWKSFMIIGFYLSLVAVLLGSKVFSLEIDLGMDKVLSIYDKNKKREITKNKISGLIYLLSKIYFISIFIILFIKLITSGLDGLGSEIQTEYFFSVFNLSFGTATLMLIIIGWLGIISVGLLTCWINFFVQKTSTTLILSLIVAFIPFIIGRIGGGASNLFVKFMKIMPLNWFSFINILTSLDVYLKHFTILTCIFVLAGIFILMTYVVMPFVSTYKSK